MADLTIKKRPVWYNLSPANLPAPGLVSIFHRISGMLLVFGLLWLLYLLDLSLKSTTDFQHVKDYLGHPIAKLAMLVMVWSFLHHLCAGIRFLLLDIHIGVKLGNARRSSFAVFAISLILTVLLGAKLW